MVFFINDAVLLERYLRGQPSYWFSRDLGVVEAYAEKPPKSTAVLPVSFAHHVKGAVGYKSGNGVFHTIRSEVARTNTLHTSWGTITPLCHFAWYVGCNAVRFIGCDGTARPKGKEYDPRLENLSKSMPGNVYAQIKACQESTCQTLGLPCIYLGTPRADVLPSVRFISYATPKYEPMMMVLADSLAAFGFQSHLESVKDRGSWAQNTAWKPEFLRLMMDEHPAERLVWLDADAELREYPEVFFKMDGAVDLAVGYRETELLSGTVYLGATLCARQIVEAWCKEQAKHPGVWDQRNLQTVVNTNSDRWDIRTLPPAYTYMDGITAREHPDVAPIIHHYQASREHKK